MVDEGIHRFVANWRAVTPELARMREEDIRRADTAQAMRAFEGLLPSVLKDRPPAPWSGLVEQQRWFMKIRDERIASGRP